MRFVAPILVFFLLFNAASVYAQTGFSPCDTVALPDTVSLCIGTSATLTASYSGFSIPDSILWTPSTALSTTTSLTTVVTPTASAYYYCTVMSLQSGNMVTNGDFTSGNSGFSSSYRYVSPTSTSLYPEGVYTVFTNPRSVHPGGASFGDHTTGSGNMLIVNGSSSPSTFWCQTITITPNTYYDFSAWAANWSSPSTGTAPILQFEINGVLIGSPDTLLTSPGTWGQFRAIWFSDTNTTATICIRDLCTVGGGNDFCLDDVFFNEYCRSTDSVYVQVNLYDTTSRRLDTAFCTTGAPVTLTTSTGYLSYLWNTGSSSTSINITTSGTYTMRATGLCSVFLDTFNVSILSLPVVRLGNDTTLCVGATTLLYSPQPSGSTFRWNTGLTADSLRTGTPGLYWLEVTRAGCKGRDSVRIFNKPNPVVLLGADTTVCAGATIQPNITPRPRVSYAWSTGAPTFSIPVFTTGNYAVTIDSNGCSGTDTIHITVYPDFSVFLGNDTAICTDDSITLQSAYSYTGASYVWNTGATSPNITVYSSGVFKLSVTVGLCTREDSINISLAPDYAVHLGDDTLICENISKILQSSDLYGSAATFLWSTGASTPAEIVDTTGTYWLEVMQNGCRRYDTVNIRIVYDSVNILNNDTAICKGSKVQAFVNTSEHGAAYTYQWLPTAGIAYYTTLQPLISPDTSATYFLQANTPGCPPAYDSFYIDVQPKPSVYLGGNQFVCQFDTLHLHAEVAPKWYGAYSYSWVPGINLDDSTISDPIFIAGTTQKYIVTVTTPAGCLGKDSLVVTVSPGNFATVSADTAICPGDVAHLRVSGGETYRWYPAMYLNDSLAADPYAAAITSQHYTVVVTSAAGCTDTAKVYVAVFANAFLSLPDSVRLFPGEQYHLQPLTNCSNFQWFPPYGLDNALGADPTVTADASTRYAVFGITENGCMASDSIMVYADPGAIILTPNAFTPNGANPIFKINRRGEARLNHFRVYNRWGNLLFETTDIDRGWDGNYNGTPQPFGVYVFEIEAVDNGGHIITRKGNVTLIR